MSPDNRPGFYYVSVHDEGRNRRTIVRGPWRDDHRGAIDAVEAVRRESEQIDPRATWYAFGTCRSDTDLGPGVLGGPIEVVP